MPLNNGNSSDHYEYFRDDLARYWTRLMWYRDELWRITTPVWGVYGAFIGSCIGFVWSSGKSGITGEMALMLVIVILTFSWVIQRMYWTYAHRIYIAITELNTEIQKREQHLYDDFLKINWKSNYGRFRVYPELNVIFSVVGLTLMLVSIFIVMAAAVGFDLGNSLADKSLLSSIEKIFALFMLCIWLVMVFEFVLLKFKKHCDVCGQKMVDTLERPTPTEPNKENQG